MNTNKHIIFLALLSGFVSISVFPNAAFAKKTAEQAYRDSGVNNAEAIRPPVIIQAPPQILGYTPQGQPIYGQQQPVYQQPIGYGQPVYGQPYNTGYNNNSGLFSGNVSAGYGSNTGALSSLGNTLGGWASSLISGIFDFLSNPLGSLMGWLKNLFNIGGNNGMGFSGAAGVSGASGYAMNGGSSGGFAGNSGFAGSSNGGGGGFRGGSSSPVGGNVDAPTRFGTAATGKTPTDYAARRAASRAQALALKDAGGPDEVIKSNYILNGEPVIIPAKNETTAKNLTPKADESLKPILEGSGLLDGDGNLTKQDGKAYTADELKGINEANPEIKAAYETEEKAYIEKNKADDLKVNKDGTLTDIGARELADIHNKKFKLDADNDLTFNDQKVKGVTRYQGRALKSYYTVAGQNDKRLIMEFDRSGKRGVIELEQVNSLGPIPVTIDGRKAIAIQGTVERADVDAFAKIDGGFDPTKDKGREIIIYMDAKTGEIFKTVVKAGSVSPGNNADRVGVTANKQGTGFKVGADGKVVANNGSSSTSTASTGATTGTTTSTTKTATTSSGAKTAKDYAQTEKPISTEGLSKVNGKYILPWGGNATLAKTTNADGSVTDKVTWGDGSYVNNTYDSSGVLISRQEGGLDGKRASLTAQKASYTYENRQLVSSTGTNGSFQQFDAQGNVTRGFAPKAGTNGTVWERTLTNADGTVETSYITDPNQITSTTGSGRATQNVKDPFKNTSGNYKQTVNPTTGEAFYEDYRYTSSGSQVPGFTEKNIPQLFNQQVRNGNLNAEGTVVYGYKDSAGRMKYVVNQPVTRNVAAPGAKRTSSVTKQETVFTYIDPGYNGK